MGFSTEDLESALGTTIPPEIKLDPAKFEEFVRRHLETALKDTSSPMAAQALSQYSSVLLTACLLPSPAAAGQPPFPNERRESSLHFAWREGEQCPRLTWHMQQEQMHQLLIGALAGRVPGEDQGHESFAGWWARYEHDQGGRLGQKIFARQRRRRLKG